MTGNVRVVCGVGLALSACLTPRRAAGQEVVHADPVESQASYTGCAVGQLFYQVQLDSAGKAQKAIPEAVLGLDVAALDGKMLRLTGMENVSTGELRVEAPDGVETLLGTCPPEYRRAIAAVARDYLASQARYFQRLARTAIEDKEYERAVELLGQALRMNPDFALAYGDRGYARYRLERYAEALSDYILAGKHGMAESERYTATCGIRLELADLAAALQDCTRAIEQDPQGELAFRHRGRVRSRQGDLDGAIADYTAALRLDPRDKLAWRFRAAVLSKKGDLGAARNDVLKALELDPEYSLAKADLAELEAMIAARKDRD